MSKHNNDNQTPNDLPQGFTAEFHVTQNEQQSAGLAYRAEREKARQQKQTAPAKKGVFFKSAKQNVNKQTPDWAEDEDSLSVKVQKKDITQESMSALRGRVAAEVSAANMAREPYEEESEKPHTHSEENDWLLNAEPQNDARSRMEATGILPQIRSVRNTGKSSGKQNKHGFKWGKKFSVLVDAWARKMKKGDSSEPSSRFFKRESINDIFTDKQKKPSYLLQVIFTTTKMFFAVIIIVMFSGLGAVLGLAKAYVDSLPDLDFTLITQQDQSSLIYDINGNLITRYYGTENREWVSLKDIPEKLQNAFIAIEDVRFYRHKGVDFKRLLGSIILNISSDSIQGGSTITQQLIKNTLLSSEQTYKRKIREAYLAIQLENTYDKKTILEAYLNTIPLGGANYGVKTAAMDYFGKELSELTTLECAVLAGLTQSPTRYNPRLNFYVRSRPEVTVNRGYLVLSEMLENGLLTLDEYNRAKDETLHVLETPPTSTSKQLQSFYEYTINDVIKHLLAAEGLDDTAANRKKIDTKLRTHGYRIYTTIDPAKQIEAENAVYSFDGYPNMRYDQDKYTIVGRNADGSVVRLQQPQASVVVMDYHTGYITAMVGGRQQPAGQKEFNRSYQSSMPIGSSIKPISVYAPAIEKGWGPGSTYWDLPLPIEGWGTENGFPSNNSGKYQGVTTMRSAIKASLNTCAAQALMYQVGINTARQALLDMGVSAEHINADGPGLALGSSGLTMLELCGAYATLANGGVYQEPISFTRIENREGKVVYDMLAQQEKHTVFSESTSWLITDLLYTALNGGGTGSNALVPGQTTYGKTGTNSDFRGVSFAGFTGWYVGAVWIGSDAYKPLISGAQGGTYAAPLFKAVMTPLHEGLEDKKAPVKTAEELNIGKIQYCLYSGRVAGDACASTVEDYAYLPNTAKFPDTSCLSVSICDESGQIATANCPHTHTVLLHNLTENNELAYMYKLYTADPVTYAALASYFTDLYTNYITCPIHTDTWQTEEQAKQDMRPAVRSLLLMADAKLATGNLSASQRQSLTELTVNLEQAYDNPQTVSLTDYQARFTILQNFLNSLG